MRVYSRILNRYYDTDQSKVVYLTNLKQVYAYLNAADEVADSLLDILYSGTRKDCLVFVFEKTPLIKELYRKWNAHELN